MTVDAIALKKKVGSVFLTKKEFSTAIGKSESYVNRILNGHVIETITLDTIYKIIETLGLSIEEIENIFFKET